MFSLYSHSDRIHVCGKHFPGFRSKLEYGAILGQTNHYNLPDCIYICIYINNQNKYDVSVFIFRISSNIYE